MKNYQFNYFEKLNNCIVFPAKGQYPITAQISGSDLDGDNFFISWDERLLVKQLSPHFIDEPKVQYKEKQQPKTKE